MPQTIKKYQKKAQYSYALGAFVTFELLKNRAEDAEAVYLHSAIDSPDLAAEIRALCAEQNVHCAVNDRLVEKLREKENCYVVGVFRKFETELAPNAPHVVLVSPSVMGNIGTIMRTCIGFGIKDLAIIQPAADVFHPKTVRASMGALFAMRFHYFSNFEDYAELYGKHAMYPFLLHGKHILQSLPHREGLFSLIFGNEATGLPDSFASVGESVTIRHSQAIDSLNLSMAVGIALYEFTK